MLAAKVLVHCRSHLSSDEEVTRLWNSASLEWSTLGVASEDIGEFLSSHVSEEMNFSDSLEHALSTLIFTFKYYIDCACGTGMNLSLSHTHTHTHTGSYLPSS